MAVVCKTCRYYRAGHFGPSGSPGKESMCEWPGEGRAPIRCAEARAAGGDCGPEGLLHMDREGA